MHPRCPPQAEVVVRPGEPRSFACSWTDSGLGAAWVRVAGDLDVATCPELDQALVEAAGGARLIVLDLRDLQFMDSSGLHLVVGATARARRRGRRLITLRGPAHIDSLFTLTGTDDHVELLDLHGAEPPVQALLKAATSGAAVR